MTLPSPIHLRHLPPSSTGTNPASWPAQSLGPIWTREKYTMRSDSFPDPLHLGCDLRTKHRQWDCSCLVLLLVYLLFTYTTKVYHASLA